MTFVISHPEILKQTTAAKENKSIFLIFIQWASNQEKYHIGWVGLSVTITAAVLFPLTMTAVLFNGANFGLIITAMVSMTLVVITNLAALPTRYTIPAFFLGILIDAVAICLSFLR
jgi:hypothetical protein